MLQQRKVALRAPATLGVSIQGFNVEYRLIHSSDSGISKV